MLGVPGRVAVEGLTIGVSFSSSASNNGGGPTLQALLDKSFFDCVTSSKETENYQNKKYEVHSHY